MKLNFSSIQIDNSQGDKNTIVGVCNGLPITVSRVLKGWQATLEIRFDGHLVHDSMPTDADRLEFTKLSERAFNERFVANDERRCKLLQSDAFAAIFKK